jgi:hypothetical protein
MAVLLITYDLNRERTGGDREGLLKYIKSHNWARLSESSYAVVSNLSPQSVTDEARKFLDLDDNIYVLNLKRPYWGWGPQEVNEWLQGNLPY